jgi:hypothetical protein
MSKNNARPVPPSTPGETGKPVAEWMLLLTMGGISAWFNIQSNAGSGKMHLDLAIGAGVAPVLAAMLSSHIVAKRRDAGTWLRIATFTVMCGAMALSAQAVGDVVRPGDPWLWWLFGPVVDAAELIALHLLLTHAAAAKAARQAAEAARQAAEAESARRLADAPDPAPSPAPDIPVPGAHGEPRPQRRSATPRFDRGTEAEAARRDYRNSKRTGTPLTDRKLAAKYNRSRTWGANRIREVEESPLSVAATGTDHARP